jgi:hypothetical protein
MGFFDKLFGGKASAGGDSALLSKTAAMMPEDQYWALIDQSIKNTDSEEDQETYLIEQLEKLPPTEIIGFRLRTDKLMYDTYTSELWCAGYVMLGGCSDDSFDYFRNWIIANGKEVYYNAKQDPDTLVVFDAEDGLFEAEWFGYVANEAFTNKTGKDLYDYIDEENLTAKEGNYSEIDFNWEEEDPESMKRICPKLFEKFEEE